MLKTTSHDSIYGVYGGATADSIDDEAAYDEQGDGYYGIEEGYESDTPHKKKAGNKYDNNEELRLINDYFKEVGKEGLLTHKQEIHMAAKIKECDQRAERIKKELSRILGRKLNGDAEKVCSELSAEFEEISDYPSDEGVSRKRMRGLAILYNTYTRTSGALKSRFVKSNLRLVASMAKKYAGRGIPFLDLIQEGNLGLMKAVERYDHSRGYRFSTYACWWINQAMIRGLFNQTRTVKIPAYVLERAGKVWSERAKFMEENGVEPHPSEIAKKVDMSVENVRQVLESGKGNSNTVRLDSPVWNEERATFMDYMVDDDNVPVDSLIAEFSIPACVEHALRFLDEREREIVKMRFGIGYDGNFTLDEVGKQFDLTRERVRQIEKKALSKIRNSESAPALKSLIEKN